MDRKVEEPASAANTEAVDHAPLVDDAPSSDTTSEDCGCGRAKREDSGAINETTAAPSFVYAIGRVEARFPDLSVEREFAQLRALEKGATAGKTERDTLYIILSKYRYLARKMCYVLAVEGIDTYLLQPEDPADFSLLLVEALRPAAGTAEVRFDVVIGARRPIAPPEQCQGLMVPVVSFDQIYSFTKESLLESIPIPASYGENVKRADPLAFGRSAEEVFDRIVQMADNAGAMDEHRALNYAAVRYPGVYARVAQEQAENRSLTAVEVRRSRLSTARNVMDVIFSFTDRVTDVTEKCFCRVDVTREFPFLVSKLTVFYEH